MTKRSPSRNSRVFAVSFPPELAKQVEAIAKEENRSISELFREAIRAYEIERRNRALDRIRAEVIRRAPSPYTENDVEALVDEVRREIFDRRRRKKMTA